MVGSDFPDGSDEAFTSNAFVADVDVFPTSSLTGCEEARMLLEIRSGSSYATVSGDYRQAVEVLVSNGSKNVGG
jgi:hypothetical protein